MNNQLGFGLFMLVVMAIVTPIQAMMRRARGNKTMPKPVYHLVGFITATIVFGCIWAGVGYFWNIPGSIRTFTIMGVLSSGTFIIISVFLEWFTDYFTVGELDDDEDDYFDD